MFPPCIGLPDCTIQYFKNPKDTDPPEKSYRLIDTFCYEFTYWLFFVHTRTDEEVYQVIKRIIVNSHLYIVTVLI
jgi:hypothetical protein